MFFSIAKPISRIKTFPVIIGKFLNVGYIQDQSAAESDYPEPDSSSILVARYKSVYRKALGYKRLSRVIFYMVAILLIMALVFLLPV